MNLHFGIDLGGTKIELVAIDNKFNILYKERILTESEKGSDHVLNQIDVLYKKANKFFGFREHTVGIGTPGSISQETGLLRNSTIYCHNGLPLTTLIENKIKHSIVIENDANCFALAEAKLGAGKNYDVVFGVILGTGCGGGIVFNNSLWSGLHGIAGEWGHSIIDMNGFKCFCGKKGCINTLISGTGLENIILLTLKKNITAEEFLNKEKYSNEEKEILYNFYTHVGKALSNIINIINPSVIIIGGGLSNHAALYGKSVEKIIKKFSSSDNEITPIVKNSLGDSAGVLGAAILPLKL